METRLKLFRTIITVNQLSIYGAVSDLCEEYSSCRTSTGRLVVASVEILAQEDLLQNRKRRVEKIPQPDRLIEICTDAGIQREHQNWTRIGSQGRNTVDFFHITMYFPNCFFEYIYHIGCAINENSMNS